MDKKLAIGFTGDFSFSGYFTGRYTDEALIDEKLLAFLNGNDANVINFESPITSCRVTKKRRLAHRSDPAALDYVKDRIKDPILSLANNHMVDYRYVGMIDTLENLEAREIRYIGAGRNAREAARYVVVGSDDFKVGIFAIQYKNRRIANQHCAGPLHDSSRERIQKTIEDMKKQVDYTVLVYHGGDEFLHVPMPYFRKHLKKYLNMGCDAVVAHHPHVVQGYESFGKKKLFYSLGNFMFDTSYQRTQEDSDRGILLRLVFSEDGIEFEHMSLRIDREKNRIVSAGPDEHFKDIKKDYRKLWPREAARKKGIEERATLLREQENAEIAEEKARLKEEARELRAKYEPVEDAEEAESAAEEVKTEPARKRGTVRLMLRNCRNAIATAFSEETYHKLVILYGAMRAR